MKERRTVLMITALFLLIGLLGLWAGISRWQQARASVTWPSIEGEITYSQIERTVRRGQNNQTRRYSYYAEIRYEYIVEGVSYSANRIAFADPPGGTGSSGENEARQTLTQYPILKKVPVYYDPNDPSNAVLEPGDSTGAYPPLIVGTLCLLAAVGLGGLTLHHRQKQGAA